MFPFFLFCTILLASWLFLRFKTARLDINSNVLLVTAHPDDEMMFFGPTLLCEIQMRVQEVGLRKRTKVHLLCLSNGNFYGEGSKRVHELSDACSYLLQYCIRSKEVLFADEIFTWSVIEDSQLVDSPAIEWPREHIASLVANYCATHQIGKVITFDQYGVSGHANHQALYHALAESVEPCVQLWALQSVPLWRKYLSVYDLLFTTIWALCSSNWHVHFVSLVDYLNLVQSLRRHASQMLWFRYLYSSTSRYMFINTLKQVR